MLRRLALIAASAGMLAISALPASAATAQSSTHKLAFPRLHGVSAWGNYTKTSKGVKLNVCAEDTVRGEFAAAAVAVASNYNGKLHIKFGAVDIGYHQTVCRSMTVRYTAHLKIYTFTGTSTGRIGSQSKTKKIY